MKDKTTKTDASKPSLKLSLGSVAAALLSGMVLFAASVLAQTRSGTCSGQLSRLKEGEWVIRIPPEGICTFRSEEIKIKVLAVCSEGQSCAVTGVLGNREDPECTQIRRVRSVRRVP